MAISKTRSEFDIAANILQGVAKRHSTLFVMAAIKLIVESKSHDSPPDLIYVVPQVWKRLVQYLRGADASYTDKGNFIVALSDMNTKENIRQFCERMISLLADEYHYKDKKYDIRIHIGLSIYPNDSDDITDMTDYAYQAADRIESRTNRLEFY